jgi:diacylglycerol kinase family enzyme
MMKRASKYIADDTEKQDKEIHIKVIPKAIKILVPKQHQSNYDR